MARLDPAIRHAITPPEFDQRKLHRERLVDQLHGEIPNKLVAIAAPAGYGKTTLLADFVANTEIPVCWLQVTDADQDVMRLAAVLLSSLELRFRRLRDALDLRAFAGSPPEGIARSISRLISEQIRETFVIVLDDVHRLNSSEGAKVFLDVLIETLPDQSVVIAAGREVIELSLARLMAENNLGGMGPHDLAFTRPEIRDLYMKETGEEPSPRTVEDLYSRTNGWVTGLLLSELTETQLGISDSLPADMAYEYLGSVVLNRQPDRIRRFLLEASILPVMSGEMCDLLMGIEGSESRLQEVHAKGLFVNASATVPKTYEFHPMFRQLLLTTLRASDPDVFNNLQARAASQLKDVDPEAAISIFLDAEDYEGAGDVIEDVAEEYFESGRFDTLGNWMASLPAPVGKYSPSLALYLSIRELDRGRYEECLDMLHGLDSVAILRPETLVRYLVTMASCLMRLGRLEEVPEILGRAETASRQADDDVCSARVLRAQAEWARMGEEDLDTAVSCIAAATRLSRVSGNDYLHMTCLQDMALFYGLAGDLPSAREATKRSLDLAKIVGSPHAQAIALNNLAQGDYLDGRYEEALKGFGEARMIAAEVGAFVREAMFIFGQADVFNDLGMTYQAAEACEQGLSIAAQAEDPLWLAYGCLTTASVHRRAGSNRLANEWLKRGHVLGKGSLAAGLDIQAAAIVLQTDPKAAVEILREATELEEVRADAQQEVLAWYFLAVALARLGDEDGSRRAYRRCLDTVSLRHAGQYIAPELEVDETSRALLSDWFSQDPTHASMIHRIDVMTAMRGHYAEKPDLDGKRDNVNLFIQALGGAKILKDGEIVDEMKPQAMEVFFLLVDNGSMERDALADSFWPEYPVGRQTANLHMAIYSIRNALGKDTVQLDGSVYRINPGLKFRYDVEEFERAVEVVMRLTQGDPRRIFALTEAVNLYNGKFLPEFFSDWASDRRRELEFLYLDVAAQHADEALLRDQPERAVRSLRVALAVDPYRDDLNEKYLRVLSRLDRRSDVLAHFQEYQRLLEEDLGLSPSEPIKAIYERIVNS